MPVENLLIKFTLSEDFSNTIYDNQIKQKSVNEKNKEE